MDLLVHSYPTDRIRDRLTAPVLPSKVAPQFAVGQTLTGSVLQVLPGEGTLVNFHGQAVLLNVTGQLVKGQTLTATVAQLSPHFVLQLAIDPTQRVHVVASNGVPEQVTNAVDETTPGLLSPATLKAYLAAKQPFGEMASTVAKLLANSPLLHALDPALLQCLRETLAVLLPQDDSLPDASRLREQVARSGINYEAQVAQVLHHDPRPAEQTQLAHDFKGQLLELAAQLEQLLATGPKALTREATELLQQVRQGLQNIELQQLTNLVAQAEKQPLLLQLTHPFFATAQTAQLYVRNNAKGDRGQQKQQHYTLVLLLDFTALGPLRVDATVHDAQVSATISVVASAIADFITAQLADLTTSLHACGFQAQVACRVQEHVSMDVDDNLTRLLLPDTSHLLDLRV